MKTDISDSIRPHLNEIAERIWAERAAVMIGAGFSKNAGDGFPDWNQLGDLFYQKAHGVAPDPAKQKYLNVLSLAEEVQAAIGRPALESLLQSSIPDLTIEPSSFHVELLELPWVDVFTTNYDTLLERASAKVVTRRYEPVINKEDIPYAIKPRIVKLHGSFPSERPFIITEEDYRRYPHENAPFVNTVQQSLLENTFCLIGFSGDDPNFLQWIGWIRDKLGRDNTQKIYLIGVFDLSSARLQLLAQRGIIVIDLSCCHGIEKHNHKKALSTFFDYIKSKKPKVLNWPYNSKTMNPTPGVDRNKEIKKVTNTWRKQRQSYPGWLVLPHGNRENLWVFTQSWVNYLPDMGKSPPGLDIQYAYELVWRLEQCLLPIFNNIAAFCEKLLERYCPLPAENPPKESQFYAEAEKFQNLSWNDLRHTWLGISLSMLRYYREEGNLEKWEETENRLKSFSDYLSAEQREFLNYEGFLYALFTLDLPNAKQRLEDWRPNEAQPYWMTKRASALAEIGLLIEAETSAKEALENIRKKLNQKVGSSNLTLVSLESYAMLVGKYIQDAAALKRNEWGTLQDNSTHFNDRWNELKGFKCDPWNELKLFELILGNSTVQRMDVTEKLEFDIGRVTRTRHFRNTDQEELSAYSFLRFCEEVALPFRIGSFTMATKTAVASLQRISRYSSFWATATLARLGDAKAADNLFNRESVYRFTADEADEVIQSYLIALQKCRDDINAVDALQNDNYGIRLAQLLPEVISRLCSKCSIEMKYQVLDLITELYASTVKRNYRNVGNLVKRLLYSMTLLEQFKLIPKLLEITFPDDLDPITKDDFLNPLRFLGLVQKPDSDVENPEINPVLVIDLLKQAVSGDEDRRGWAITSLVKLYELQLLDSDQTKKLATAIWFKTDIFGLPKSNNFYKFVFLKLPHPNGIEPSKRFKNFIKSTAFPIQNRKQKKSVSITGGNIPLINEIIGAENNDENFWTEEDVIEILQRLLKWWNADKNRLNEKDRAPAIISSIPEEFQSRFNRLIELLAKVIGPRLKESVNEDIKFDLNKLLNEMDAHNLPILQAKAACLHILPEQKIELYNRIKHSLISNKNELVNDGLGAIEIIVINNSYSENRTEDNDPLLALTQYITWCSKISITQALWIVIRILKNTPNLFTCTLEKSTLKSLEKLLAETEYGNDKSEFTFSEKLAIRRVAVNLAITLCTHYKSHSTPIPKIIISWRKSCSSPDEFSEIRNLWECCDCESF